MTNSSRETDIRDSGSDNVAYPPNTEIQAPHAVLQGTAGEVTDVTPRQFTADEVFETLVRTIAEFETVGKVATAAGVSARMRQLQPGFSVANTEFATFRDITRAAENAGLVTATRTSSDYLLKLLKHVQGNPVQHEGFHGATLQPDLWRAIQDWTDGVHYAFNRATKKTEPMGSTLPAGSVAIPSVDKPTNIQWMREFATTQATNLAHLVEEALAESDPAAGFHQLTRENETIKRRWTKYLRNRVLETAVSWATANDIPRADVFVPTPPRQSPATVSNEPRITPAGEDVDARRRVLEILESMPLHELLRLPIPLEYSLKR